MKKLSVEEEEEANQVLIKCKYPYPCTIYDKEGNVIRVVTYNVAKALELTKLRPALKKFINSYEDDEVVPAPTTVKQLLTTLGK